MENRLTDLLTLGQAAEDPSCFGGRVSHFTVRRWTAKGVGSPPIKLKSIRIGGRYFLHPDDIREFKEAIADPELYRRRQATERCEKAKRRLQKAGA